MPMMALIYDSTAQIEFEPKALVRLADEAAAHNETINVTGYLYFNVGRFFQYIEGPADSVNELMASIEQDSRHRIDTVLRDAELPRRRFSDWSMRRINLAVMGFEEIIDQSLSMCRKNFPEAENRVWRVMDKLSKHRERLLIQPSQTSDPFNFPPVD